MKYFLSTTAFVASVVMLLALAPGRSLTAETNAAATFSGEPIKVLSVKLAEQSKKIESLEVEIQNTSGRPIQYLLVHAEIPGKDGPLRIPMRFGNAPVPNFKGKVELLQPGAKFTLSASKNMCERITREISKSERAVSTNDIQPKLNVAIFADRTAWGGGQLNHPDPNNSWRWIAATELARHKSLASLGTIAFSKAGYKREGKSQGCFRYTGGSLQWCCEDMYVFSANFTGDPNGTVQPTPNPACCSPGDCCEYDTPGACP